MSQKYEGHRLREPTPLEELAPEAPGGLALVAHRMMAKKPEDRFQSAAEVAAALAPFVAGSSRSFGKIRETASWRGSSLTLRDMPGPSRRRAWLLAAAAAFLLLGLGVTAGVLWSNAQDDPVVRNDDGSGLPPYDGKPGDGKKDGTPPKIVVRKEPNVLTVTQKPEAGGEYRSLSEALAKVQAGQTIRVLDDAVYREHLRLMLGSKFRGVTLEAVKGAVLENDQADNLIQLHGLTKFTLRGLKLRVVDTQKRPIPPALIYITDHCSDLLLEDLELEAVGGTPCIGMEVYSLPDTLVEGPMTIRRCVFRQVPTGIGLFGDGGKPNSSQPLHQVIIRDNFLDGTRFQSILLRGELYDIQVVGNRINGAGLVGIQLDSIPARARNILIANNSVLECRQGFRLWDRQPLRSRDVHIHNNLFLASITSDMIFLDSGGSPTNLKGPGDGAALVRGWQISHNWREARKGTPRGPGWVPQGNDEVHERIEGVNREPGDRFLHLEKNSPLATSGAGRADSSLPTYVGAMPPEGVKAWDWDATWRARLKPAP